MPAWRNGYFTKHQTGVIISHFSGDQTIHHCFVRISPLTLHYSRNVMTPAIFKRKQNRFLRISVLVILLAASSCHQQTATGWCHSDRIRCGDSWWFQRLLFTRKICGRFPGWWCSYAFTLVVQPGMRVPRNLGDSQTIGFLDNEPISVGTWETKKELRHKRKKLQPPGKWAAHYSTSAISVYHILSKLLFQKALRSGRCEEWAKLVNLGYQQKCRALKLACDGIQSQSLVIQGA